MADPTIPIWEQRDTDQLRLVLHTPDIHQRLKRNYATLVQVMEPRSLWPFLLQKSVVTNLQKDEITVFILCYDIIYDFLSDLNGSPLIL